MAEISIYSKYYVKLLITIMILIRFKVPTRAVLHGAARIVPLRKGHVTERGRSRTLPPCHGAHVRIALDVRYAGGCRTLCSVGTVFFFFAFLLLSFCFFLFFEVPKAFWVFWDTRSILDIPHPPKTFQIEDLLVR